MRRRRRPEEGGKDSAAVSAPATVSLGLTARTASNSSTKRPAASRFYTLTQPTVNSCGGVATVTQPRAERRYRAASSYV